jgi:hypothetical protein
MQTTKRDWSNGWALAFQANDSGFDSPVSLQISVLDPFLLSAKDRQKPMTLKGYKGVTYEGLLRYSQI